MTTSEAVDKARALLEERRSELKRELAQIEQALSGLGRGRRGPGRPRGSASRPTGKRRRRRRGGTRADHAHKYVAAHPGATASEIAGSMGIKPNYVYRVMAELEKDGRVRKDGKGYHATADSVVIDDGAPGKQG
jgi:sugar-specific transcriptional regulator TrmB